MNRSVDVPRAALALGFVWVVACSLDPRSKIACAVDGDCLAGRACIHGSCSPAAADQRDGGTQATSQSGSLPPEAGLPEFMPCQSLPAAQSCGTTAAGTPMTCFQASALAGEDFCVEKCDPSAAPADPDHFQCQTSGALLQRCHPNAGPSAQADCPPNLSCFRTNLATDSGLCIRMPVCTADSDCPMTAHGTCAATLIRNLVPPSAVLLSYLHIDHLNCVHSKCQSQLSACSSAEDCLGANFLGSFDDLCIPRCDSNQNCPPNYSCGLVYTSTGPSQLCLPGVPGARCSGTGCLVGDCEDSGAGFGICTIPCTDNSACALLDTTSDSFVCVIGGGAQHCVTARSFSGANCASSSECLPGEFCATVDRSGTIMGHGECRVPCSNGTCGLRGGLPHGCLWNGDGGCFPALLGVACTSQDGCIQPLACESVPPEAGIPAMGGTVCSAPCGVDGGTDQDGDPQCGVPPLDGYCAGQWCRPPRMDGAPCDRPKQCGSRICDAVTHTCRP